MADRSEASLHIASVVFEGVCLLVCAAANTELREVQRVLELLECYCVTLEKGSNLCGCTEGGPTRRAHHALCAAYRIRLFAFLPVTIAV